MTMDRKKLSFYLGVFVPLAFFLFMYLYVYYIDPYKKTFDQALSNVVASHVYHQAPKIQHRLDANFEDKIILLGYNINSTKASPYRDTELTLYYRCLKKVDGPYRIFMHIQSKGWMNKDHDPVFGLYPVDKWKPGEVIEDPVRFRIPAGDIAQENTVWTGFFDTRNNDRRLKVVNAGDVETDGHDRVLIVKLKGRRRP